MIVIEIINVNHLVEREKGKIAAKVGAFLLDLEAEVEKNIIAEIKATFAQKGVQAKIRRVARLKLPDSDEEEVV
jgi:hypothetical protein